jgi:single-stranded-DNA-specific exonuclease
LALAGWVFVPLALGGHAGAAGLTIEPERFPRFRDAFHEWVAERLDDDTRAPTLHVDADVAPEDVNPALCADLERLEPFGEGNPPVVLALRGVTVSGTPRRMGASNEHVSFFVGRGGRALRCVAFRDAARLAPILQPGARIDVAFTPQRNDFRGSDEAEGAVVDLRPTPA